MIDPMQDAIDPLPRDFIPCTLRALPERLNQIAAQRAIAVNPANNFNFQGLVNLLVGNVDADAETPPEAMPLPALKIAGVVGKLWKGAVDLGVTFIDRGVTADLGRRVLEHMNAWQTAAGANVKFYSSTRGEVRISFGPGGYWSYLGTDILSIPAGEPTMNLERFSMATPESEYRRVVRHETGHTLGFPHEHMRAELVARLDPAKCYRYFRQTQGWNRREVDAQVLTPLSEASLRATAHADQDSIMCYQLPGTITVDGEPISGGDDIDRVDAQFARDLYPRETPRPNGSFTIEAWDQAGKKYRGTMEPV